jgi:hypothetical protein
VDFGALLWLNQSVANQLRTAESILHPWPTSAALHVLIYRFHQYEGETDLGSGSAFGHLMSIARDSCPRPVDETVIPPSCSRADYRLACERLARVLITRKENVSEFSPAFPWEIEPPVGNHHVKEKRRLKARARRPPARTCVNKKCGRKYQPRRWSQCRARNACGESAAGRCQAEKPYQSAHRGAWRVAALYRPAAGISHRAPPIRRATENSYVWRLCSRSARIMPITMAM